MRSLAGIPGIVAAVGLSGCGGDSLSLSVSPELRHSDDPPGRSLGVNLSEDFSVEILRCPSSLDHPDCSSEPVGDIALEWSAQIAALEDSEVAHFLLTGLARGSAEITIDASGVERTRFVVTTEDVLTSRVFPLFSFDPSQDGRELVFADSDPIPMGQAHYATQDPTESRAALMGYATMNLFPASTDAELLPDDVSRARRQFHPGSKLGAVTISTAVGGEALIEIVGGSAIDGFDAVGDRYTGDPLQTLSLSASTGYSVVQLRPWNPEGRWIRGNGGPSPDVVTSTDAVEIIPTPESSVLPWEQSFALAPSHSGSAEITVRWGDAEYSFDVVVSED